MPVKRIILAAFLAASVLSSGCKCMESRSNRSKPRPDLPEYSIEEQKRRARDRYAWQDDDFRIGPSSGFDRPSPIGR